MFIRLVKYLSSKGCLETEIRFTRERKVVEKVTDPTEWVNSVIVYKKDGNLRLCLDPTDLNRAIKPEHYKIPTLSEITNRINGAKYFSTVDCSKLDEESSKLCTFNTPFGRYKFLRMPYGISSAPEIFTKNIKQL